MTVHLLPIRNFQFSRIYKKRKFLIRIGAPITFLDKYNPKQFEIIALGIVGSINFTCNKKMEILENGTPTGKYTYNAKGTLYKKYNPQYDRKPPAFRDAETDELYSSIYARVIIRRKSIASCAMSYAFENGE